MGVFRGINVLLCKLILYRAQGPFSSKSTPYIRFFILFKPRNLSKKILAVPTNIITGFLGVGKTSAILHLLKHKPADERWAVLVNEFGEIGVDGSLFQGQHAEDKGVFIREVPGGCMCCAASLPMQIALNLLLARAKPDRLLIEPTGLGHPVEVLQVLSEDHYRDVLSIQKILTLVDARKLADKRYTEHATFNQQIAIADIVVGNKQDLYDPGDKIRLESYVKDSIKDSGASKAKVVFTEQGILKPDLLIGKTAATSHAVHKHLDPAQPINLNEVPMPECGYIKAVNQGEGFESVGWRFDVSKLFDRDKVFGFLSSLSVERMKAIFITQQGIFGYNLTSDALTEIELDDCLESRIEIIATRVNEEWEAQLLACVNGQG
ncbi:MAG: GTP-binding protein [Gammaproteobacteria bacterium]|nr:GTP-binding protein [Gammaproteobacteria bacterium]